MTAAPAIPDGMVAWHGGDSAPVDWDGGPVLLRDGAIWPGACDWRWGNPPHCGRTADSDIIAYTPKPAAPACRLTPAGDGERVRALMEAAAKIAEGYTYYEASDYPVCQSIAYDIRALADREKPTALAGAGDDPVAVERERCISVIAAYCRGMEAAGKSPRFSDLPAAIRSGEPAR